MLFVVMKYLSFFLVLGLLFNFGCKDEINDPNPDGGQIIDSIGPTYTVISPKADSTYLGLDTLEIKIDVRDDILLESFEFTLGSTNVLTDEYRIDIMKEDSAYAIDTFYVVPANDTLKMQAFMRAKDYAGNDKFSSFNFSLYR